MIYHHYAAKRNGRAPLPTLFCNTCFTRGGGWLNECNASNQIPLIEAYAPLGLEALITDAGWFEGGWPARADHAARQLWFARSAGPFLRPDLSEGMILVFRRAESPYRTTEVALHGLNAGKCIDSFSGASNER